MKALEAKKDSSRINLTNKLIYLKMRTATNILLLGILSVFVLVHCEEENNEVGETLPEALQDLQTEFWLPYSVTEDVDFSIVRPEAYGCYQWYEQ